MKPNFYIKPASLVAIGLLMGVAIPTEAAVSYSPPENNYNDQLELQAQYYKYIKQLNKEREQPSQQQQQQQPPVNANDLLEQPEVTNNRQQQPHQIQKQQVLVSSHAQNLNQNHDSGSGSVINGNQATYVEPPADFKPIIYEFEPKQKPQTQEQQLGGEESGKRQVVTSADHLPSSSVGDQSFDHISGQQHARPSHDYHHHHQQVVAAFPQTLDDSLIAAQASLASSSVSSASASANSLDGDKLMGNQILTGNGNSLSASMKPSIGRWTDWTDMSIEPDLASSDVSAVSPATGVSSLLSRPSMPGGSARFAVPAQAPFRIRNRSGSFAGMPRSTDSNQIFARSVGRVLEGETASIDDLEPAETKSIMSTVVVAAAAAPPQVVSSGVNGELTSNGVGPKSNGIASSASRANQQQVVAVSFNEALAPGTKTNSAINSAKSSPSNGNSGWVSGGNSNNNYNQDHLRAPVNRYQQQQQTGNGSTKTKTTHLVVQQLPPKSSSAININGQQTSRRAGTKQRRKAKTNAEVKIQQLVALSQYAALQQQQQQPLVGGANQVSSFNTGAVMLPQQPMQFVSMPVMPAGGVMPLMRRLDFANNQQPYYPQQVAHPYQQPNYNPYHSQMMQQQQQPLVAAAPNGALVSYPDMMSQDNERAPAKLVPGQPQVILHRFGAAPLANLASSNLDASKEQQQTIPKNSTTAKRSLRKRQKRIKTQLPVGLTSWFLGGIRDLDGRHWQLPADLVQKLTVNDVDLTHPIGFEPVKVEPPAVGSVVVLSGSQPPVPVKPAQGSQPAQRVSINQLIPRRR